MAQDFATKVRRARSVTRKAQERERVASLVHCGPPPTLRSVNPEPKDLIISTHALDKFADRVQRYCGNQDPHKVIARVVCTGRRSDWDSGLKVELACWVRFVTWHHDGRPVTLFFEQATRIGILAVASREGDGRVVVLTCFSARDTDVAAAR